MIKPLQKIAHNLHSVDGDDEDQINELNQSQLEEVMQHRSFVQYIDQFHSLPK